MSHFETRLDELKRAWARLEETTPVKPKRRPEGKLAAAHAAKIASTLIVGLGYALGRAEVGDEEQTWVAFKKMQAWLDDNMGSP